MRQTIRISSRRHPAAELAADGADLPTQGITGQGTLQAVWREEQKQLELDNLNLQANDSSLKGQASVTLEEKPKWVLNLQFDKLNLENLLPPLPASATDSDARRRGKARHRYHVRLSRRISISLTITPCADSRRIFC
jgi:autotransporter translocation and assembly factor TamB